LHSQDLHFGSVTIAAGDGQYFFDVRIHLGRVKPGDVRIEIYADALDFERTFRESMTFVRAVLNAPGTYQYVGVVPSNRPVNHYTPRAIPYHEGALIPLEIPLIAWQK
jgi:starch phosphorylase